MIQKSVAFAILMVLAGATRAGTPVTVVYDATASANQVANIAQYAKQVVLLQQQYVQLQQSYHALNGLRNVGLLMNNDLLAQFLPADYQRAYAALKSGQGGSLAGISGTLNQIAAANQAQSCRSASVSAGSVEACNRSWQTLAMNKYVGQAGYDQTAGNIGRLQQFVNAITSSPDPKAMQDLQARIAVEQVKMQNEQMKLQTVAMMQRADEDLARARNAQTTQQALMAPMNLRWGANAANN
ncbi:type IV secretion system protein [Massilia sp. R2A-15]|uniref:type IV secretion system protein n=1 Tax=Massilia sp. R2A-15 TaxID=3064278 RepID=UPI002732970D|nr:type IV secretion system protein [Massilia sp. R2A-15]WLI87824.1 type IV secretion system protein [Massilia sp. R2A-15]